MPAISERRFQNLVLHMLGTIFIAVINPRIGDPQAPKPKYPQTMKQLIEALNETEKD